MDFAIAASIDPSVPFRAARNHIHHTWANTFYCRPELYIQPQSIQELQKVVSLARRCRRRIAITGCGHSPSDLTMTSSWLVNLDHLSKMLKANSSTGVVVIQAGIRLQDLGLKLKEHGLAMQNLGSIDNQSIAGAIGTATHGSSLRHGILSESVLALKILLADGRLLYCSKDEDEPLFRAALVSLGALGIIVEITFQSVPQFNIEWSQSLHPLKNIIADWEKELWKQNEFTRIWWMPYTKQCIRWRADKTDRALKTHAKGVWSGKMGYWTYHILLYVSQWVPSIIPLLEGFVTRVQYGLGNGKVYTGVEEGRTGLLMNCLYSQFVNEWAVPLHKGPEILTRLSAWLNGDEESSGIPFSSNGLYVHAPIEVRVTDTTISPRPYLDNTVADGPTLYLNATLYRPFGCDPPCKHRYYEAFEWLMKEMKGRPHWAKNFQGVTHKDLQDMYPELKDWVRVRNEVDPNGMFVGDWVRRNLLESDANAFLMEERQVETSPAASGGLDWTGETAGRNSPQSEESYDFVHSVEAEKSALLGDSRQLEQGEEQEL